MTTFEDTFNVWMNKKVKHQLEIIDNISSETDINPQKWFTENFLRRQVDDFTGTEFVSVLLENYLCYLSNCFDRIVGDYLESTHNNVYGEPIFDIYMTLEYSYDKNKLFINEQFGEISDIESVIKSISIDNRYELTKNKLFSYIINETKLNIFSNKEIRALKLKCLNEI